MSFEVRRWRVSPPRSRRECVVCALVLVFGLVTAGHARAASDAPLAERVSDILDASEFRAARWGVYAVALETGEVLYSRDADRRFIPASNLKLYTTALALARLGPTYRWRTSVYARAKPDRSGRIAGDVVVYGRGDPTISARFADDDPLGKIERLADAIAGRGRPSHHR